MKDLFISWAGSHAHKVAERICSVFAPCTENFEVFLSSRDIRNSKIWQDELQDRLRNSSRGVIIFSQEAIKSDWLLHESAVLSSRMEHPFIFLLGAPREMLPQPLRRFQIEPLNWETLKVWFNDIRAEKGLDLTDDSRDRFLQEVIDIVKEYKEQRVTAAEDSWRNSLSRPIAISKQDNSPYDVSEILRIAKRQVTLVAQNHGYMVNPKSAKFRLIEDLLFKKLTQGVDIEIIAMHPAARPSIDGTGLDGSHASAVWAAYLGVRDFASHLDRCWTTLRKWNERYKQLSPSPAGRLWIQAAFFLPVSINIVDPDNQDGFLVLSPRMAQGGGGVRPQIILTKAYEETLFEHYRQIVFASRDISGLQSIDELPPPPPAAANQF